MVVMPTVFGWMQLPVVGYIGTWRPSQLGRRLYSVVVQQSGDLCLEKHLSCCIHQLDTRLGIDRLRMDNCFAYLLCFKLIFNNFVEYLFIKNRYFFNFIWL